MKVSPGLKVSAVSLPLALLCFGAGGLKAAGLPEIQKGSEVTFHYQLTVDSKLVDSSPAGSPLTYVQGSGQMIPGLEEQMKGLKKGSKKKFSVPPEKGYGPVNPQAFQNVPLKSFRKAKGLKVGTIVSGKFSGSPIQARVIAIEDKNVTLDLNHPLAGKTLQFDVEVLKVAPPQWPGRHTVK